MGLDIYFREDLENTTEALELAADYMALDDRQGWLACCGAFRKAFGLPPRTLEVPGRTMEILPPRDTVERR